MFGGSQFFLVFYLFPYDFLVVCGSSETSIGVQRFYYVWEVYPTKRHWKILFGISTDYEFFSFALKKHKIKCYRAISRMNPAWYISKKSFFHVWQRSEIRNPNFYIHKYKIPSTFHVVKDQFDLSVSAPGKVRLLCLTCLSMSCYGEISLSSTAGLQGHLETATNSMREISPRVFSLNDPSVGLTLYLSMLPAASDCKHPWETQSLWNTLC